MEALPNTVSSLHESFPLKLKSMIKVVKPRLPIKISSSIRKQELGISHNTLQTQ